MKNRRVKKGEIYYYDFGNRQGTVQSGKRPVLILQTNDFNDNSATTMVAILTSATKKRYLPSHIFLGEEYGLSEPSMVMLEQTSTVNQNDLQEYIGVIKDEKTINQITKGLKKAFGLWVYNTKRKADVRCLCSNCLSDLMHSTNSIIHRLDPLSKEKDKCDKCNRFGYDYVITERKTTY